MSQESAVKILRGAEQLFFKYGIKNITMDDVAKHLSISKKTIYQFFKDKDEMVHSLMALSLDDDKCRIQSAHDNSKNVVEEVFKIMDSMREIFSKVNPILFFELNKYYPETWKMFMKFKNEFILKTVENSLLRGQKEGYIRENINVKLLSKLRVELVELGMKGEMFPHDQFEILEVQLALTEHFLYGVCTLKGHRLINKYKNIEEE
ncbi:MAG: TetR/AcrR family transcriptional regulator [Bacteroidetes bacterium]|jgi:AcrR family transcriptional regulator|nr:TetR/AcrR family transcriptional regulator [Bacteroidota bacterium]MCA6444010.1 TetR/AcrR family transcriptional regulator [Bacteroidota bacterium]